MNKNSIIITVVAVLIVGAGAFFGGMKYQQAQGASVSGNRFAQAGRFSTGRFGRQSMATVGKVVGSDANSITLQLKDGSCKIINISGSTSIVKTTKGSQSDLTNGTNVAVFGTTNSDGSVTAQNVQINPMEFRARPMPSPTQ